MTTERVLSILLLLLCCSSLLWLGTEAIMHEDLNTLFTEEIIRIYCPPPANPAYQECLEITMENIRSLKLSMFYNQRLLFQGKLRTELGKFVDAEKEAVNLHYGSTLFHDKVKILQNVVDDKRVDRICEIGMFGGLSTVAFLLANPKASVVIFDGDQQERFSKATANTLLSTFPDRRINIIHGDWKYSIKNYFQEFGHLATCNIMYIDGRQDEDTLLHILRYLIPMMNTQFNRIVLDNFEYPHIQNMYHYVTNKINVGVDCPVRATESMLEDVSVPFTGENQPTGVDTWMNIPTVGLVTNIGSGKVQKKCNLKIETVIAPKGMTYTPCIMHYTNETGGLHSEFVFSLQNCSPTPLPEDALQEYPLDPSLEMMISTVKTAGTPSSATGNPPKKV